MLKVFIKPPRSVSLFLVLWGMVSGIVPYSVVGACGLRESRYPLTGIGVS